jgi:hypothetical protein
MRRPGEHEKKRVNDVVVAQPAMRGDPTLDLFRIGQAPSSFKTIPGANDPIRTLCLAICRRTP